MKLVDLPSEFKQATTLLAKIKEAGFEAYFVGGSVRDVLLQRPIHDIDIATSSYPEETKGLFKHTVDIGIEHGTVLVLEGGEGYEITTFRTEADYTDYRRPSQVTFVRSLKEDLKRRDFTVNALALDETGQVIDLFNGLHDLDHHILRAVGEATKRFEEDALRIMRGVRFVASLGFTIESATFKAMMTQAHLLEKIAIERCFVEFDLLLQAPHWKKGIANLITTNVYQYLPFPSFSDKSWQAFSQAFAADFFFKSSEQAWAALILHLGISDSDSFLKRWKTSRQFQQAVKRIITVFQLRQKGKVSPFELYQFGASCFFAVEDLRLGLGLSADFAMIEQIKETLPITSRQDMVIDGSWLIETFDLTPGPVIGDLLNAIEYAIVTQKISNQKAAILVFVRETLAQNDRK